MNQMPIFVPPGSRVVLAFPDHGTLSDQARLSRLGLVRGAVFTVQATEALPFRTTLFLREFPNERFNTVNFALADSAPEESPEAAMISAAILAAKLGRSRKDAQIETCAVFAAALYDALLARGTAACLATAISRGLTPWAHQVVAAEGRYFDSMGEFSGDIYRRRAKLHPRVAVTIEYEADSRLDCFDEEFQELHAFYLRGLERAFLSLDQPTSTTMP